MVTEQISRQRCFGQGDELMADYHDNEWGIPVHNAPELFEHLSLDIFQSGLSWRVILAKRENFRRAFDGFDPHKIADYKARDVERLMADQSIVRNRRKIEATINNAQIFVDMKRGGEDFDELLWSFVGSEPIKGPPASSWQELPTKNEQSAAMAKELKERGFKFVGPTVCYAFMQAVGMIDDHLVGCFRFRSAE